MKKRQIISFFPLLIMGVFLVFASGCKKDNEDDNVPSTNGLIEFKCINPMGSSLKSTSFQMKSTLSNPSLVGDTTETIMTSMKWTIGDVWVSKGEVKVNEPDNLEWIRITNNTNTEMKLFEEYAFPAKEIPAGDYKSIKITFRNIWYRQVKLTSNPSIVYELLESMGSSTDACDPSDTTWAKTNYFGPDGNHYLNDNGIFQLASEGEKISGLKIESGKKSIVSWRLGAGTTGTCTNYLIDINGNREWDCGVDKVEDVCPPDMEYMWDFVVEYE